MTRLPEAVLRQERQSEEAFEALRAAREAAMQPQPEPEPEPAPAAPVIEPAVETPKEREDWKAKYLVLQGKYNAEVPLLAQQVRALTAEIRQLRAQAAPAPAPVATPAAMSEKFDPELVSAVDQLIQQRTREALEPVAGTVQQNAFDLFVSRVRAIVPDQQQVDLDPAFETYMSEFDAFSGRTRQQLLEAAVEAHDAQRVAAFYLAFKSTVSGANPVPVVQPSPPAPPAPPAPTPPPVIPAQTGSPGAPGQKKVWSSAEIAAFYSAGSKGHYRNRESEFASIEAEILAAHREGRVR